MSDSSTSTRQKDRKDALDLSKPWLISKSGAWATRVLIVINVIAFVAFVCQSDWQTLILPAAPALLEFGASSGAATVIGGQLFRLVTCAFVHVGLIHLALNIFVLWFIGPIVEKLFGDVKFLVIYFTAAIGGSVASLIWDPTLISAGASGAIFGLFGAMFVFVFCHRQELTAEALAGYGRFLAIVIGYAIICGIMIEGLDNAAHLGGFLLGAMAGLSVMPLSAGDRFWTRGDLLRWLCVSVLVGATLSLNLKSIASTPRVICDAHTFKALKLVEKQSYNEALPLLDKALAIEPDYRLALVTRARIYQRFGRFQDAVADLSHCLTLGSDNAMVYNNRAWAYDALRDYDKALADCQIAVERDPSNAAAYDTRGVAYLGLNKLDAALSDFNKSISMASSDGAPYYHRARVLKLENKEAEAERDEHKASKLGYEPESWETR